MCVQSCSIMHYMYLCTFQASSCSVEVMAVNSDGDTSGSPPPKALVASVSDEGLFQLMLAPGKYTIKVTRR